MSTWPASTLAPALAGDCIALDGGAGALACYVGGPPDGAPLLLVHSINAAASAFEIKPVYDWAVAQGRRVYAPDLPGFGRSPRGPRDYTIRLYTDAVHQGLQHAGRAHGAAAVDVLGLSLGSEFVARAAVEAPQRVRTLTLVTPTGFMRGNARRTGAPQTSLEVPGLRGAFDNRLWGQPLFDLLVSRRSVRYFMRRTFGTQHGGVEPPAGLIDYAYASAHQPGARHAPYAFVSARLFARDIRRVYEALTQPVWVPHATRGDFRDFSDAEPLRSRPNWIFTPMPTGAMPFWEQPQPFMRAFAAVLAGGRP
jgi:pimeloyl-ACP methyl ester carboxylesterase